MTDESPSVVVTGVASGMGEAVAARFVAEGWRVLALDVDSGGLGRLQSDLGHEVRPLAVDIRDRPAVDAVLTAARDVGHVSAVVNAAGIYPTTTLADYSEKTYRRIFDVNVLGTR